MNHRCTRYLSSTTGQSFACGQVITEAEFQALPEQEQLEHFDNYSYIAGPIKPIALTADDARAELYRKKGLR